MSEQLQLRRDLQELSQAIRELTLATRDLTEEQGRGAQITEVDVFRANL